MKNQKHVLTTEIDKLESDLTVLKLQQMERSNRRTTPDSRRSRKTCRS